MNPTMTYLNIVLHQVSINPAKAMGAPPQPSPAISIAVGTLTTASSKGSAEEEGDRAKPREDVP